MNTIAEQSAVSGQKSAITEAQVIAWMQARCREIIQRTGCKTDVTFSLHCRISEPASDSDHTYYNAHAWGECSMQDTAVEAINAIIDSCSGMLAQDKRNKANELLRQAEQIEVARAGGAA